MRGQGNPWKWVVGALLVVIVVAAVALLASLSPLLSAGLAGDGGGGGSSADVVDATPTPTGTAPSSTPTASNVPSYPVPTPSADDTPTATLPPTESDSRQVLAVTFDGTAALDAWQVSTEGTGDGEAAVLDGRLRLRVHRCHRVVVARDLGRVDGRLRVAFDWASAAEEWYEYPEWELVAANGTALDYTVVAGRDLERPDRSSEKYGRVAVETTADTAVTLRFRVRPSQYCGRANHANTYLWVDNVTVVERAAG